MPWPISLIFSYWCSCVDWIIRRRGAWWAGASASEACSSASNIILEKKWKIGQNHHFYPVSNTIAVTCLAEGRARAGRMLAFGCLFFIFYLKCTVMNRDSSGKKPKKSPNEKLLKSVYCKQKSKFEHSPMANRSISREQIKNQIKKVVYHVQDNKLASRHYS